MNANSHPGQRCECDGRCERGKKLNVFVRQARRGRDTGGSEWKPTYRGSGFPASCQFWRKVPPKAEKERLVLAHSHLPRGDL